MDALSIIQLNCNSIRSKLSEVKKMDYVRKLEIVCLSETWLETHNPNFYGYSAEWKNRNRRGGDLGILVASKIPYSPVNLNVFNGGFLEVQAVKIKTKAQDDINILNIYNPNENITEEELRFYIHQLGSKYIIVRDLNAHTPALDNRYQLYKNPTGTALENILIDEDLVLINPVNFITYLDCRTG